MDKYNACTEFRLINQEKGFDTSAHGSIIVKQGFDDKTGFVVITNTRNTMTDVIFQGICDCNPVYNDPTMPSFILLENYYSHGMLYDSRTESFLQTQPFLVKEFETDKQKWICGMIALHKGRLSSSQGCIVVPNLPSFKKPSSDFIYSLKIIRLQK